MINYSCIGIHTNFTEELFMSESMDDYKDELDASFKRINEGDLLDCTVVGVSETEATVDLQYNSAGIIRQEDFSSDPSFSIKQDVQIGDTFKATVLRMDDGRGNILLSKKAADSVLVWEKFAQMMKDGTAAEMKISEAVKGGAVGYLDGMRAFIPASKLSLEYVDDLSTWVGKTIPVRIITAEKETNKLVVSSREILREERDKEKANLVSNMQVGLVTEGTVESLQAYGAFVNLGNGIDGLVHISQITNAKRLKHPKEMLSVGDKVKVKIIGIKDGKVSLSMKALEDQAPVAIEEEKVNLPKSEELTTSLGSLLKDIKLN